jgi:RNA polymerase sigma-70 factor (ECF subfamily)
MADVQELAIIEDVQDGNQESYRFLVERYHRGLILHLCNLMHDEQSAEDVAQEAFIRAYDKLAQYDRAYAFSTWLYKIADSIALRQLKRVKPTVDLADSESFLADDRPSLPETADRAMRGEAVRRAVDALPLHYRQVVALYYWDGSSYEEIAVIVGKPIGTVRTWLYRAKEELRKELYGRI